MVLQSGSGPFEVPDNFLFVGIDETGHEEFLGGHPTFGLGGCAMPARTYQSLVREPWLDLKEKHFGGSNTLLHVHELRAPRDEQITAIADFFRSNHFGRFAALVSADTERDSTVPAYQIAAQQILDFVTGLVNVFNCEGIALIIEDSQRTNRLARAYFEGYEIVRGSGEISVPLMKFRMRRSVGEPLSEVADFIVHTAGSQTRSARKGYAWDARRDFEAVFRSIDPSLVPFIDMTGIRVADATT
jgi:hypothetical protein